MTWQEQIPGGFAGMTASFAMHPNDENRAFTMLETMREQGVTWAEAKAAIQDYLTGKNVTSNERAKQMGRAEERLRPWLS